MIANMQNLVCCLIFFSAFRGIKGDFVNNGEQGNIASPRPFWDEYNFGETADETVITEEDEPEDDEDFDDNRLGKSSVENLKLYKEILEAQRKVNGSNDIILQRKAREKKDDEENIGCLQCYGFNEEVNMSTSFENCLSGINVSYVECSSEAKQCFIELHPYFIKRDCFEPMKLNVTFHCKCTLCNDKPADKREYFTYDNIKDWSFDNTRLQRPYLPGVTAACKYCNTTNAGYLHTCVDGTNVEYTICNEGEVCFTHIDKYKGIMSRGCAMKPAYNSFFIFCNHSDCNNRNFLNSDDAFQIYGNRSRLVYGPLKLTESGKSNTLPDINQILLFISLINLHTNAL